MDYRKWDNIEISDDEEDTHPNIDTPSLFRWRHRARMERMEQHRRQKEQLEKSKQSHEQKLETTQKKLLETEKNVGDICEIKKSLDQLKLEAQVLEQQEKEIHEKEKITPWNVDTISKPGFSRTVVNKTQEKREKTLSLEEQESGLNVFIKENEKILKEFGFLRKYSDSRKFLLEHPHLVCDDTSSYLAILCINLQLEKKQDLLKVVAHQVVCIQYILGLAKHLEVDPRVCVATFFSKIVTANTEYKQEFIGEVEAMIERVQKKANEKLEEAAAQERQARLGPGGLDPDEVFDSLPESLKACFESQDVGLLKLTLARMPAEEAACYMKRFVDSGMLEPKENEAHHKDGESSKTADGGDDEKRFAQ